MDGKLFQTRAAAIGKALSPAGVLVEGTRRAEVDKDGDETVRHKPDEAIPTNRLAQNHENTES
jgi:hypothetical protein